MASMASRNPNVNPANVEYHKSQREKEEAHAYLRTMTKRKAERQLMKQRVMVGNFLTKLYSDHVVSSSPTIRARRRPSLSSKKKKM